MKKNAYHKICICISHIQIPIRFYYVIKIHMPMLIKNVYSLLLHPTVLDILIKILIFEKRIRNEKYEKIWQSNES